MTKPVVWSTQAGDLNIENATEIEFVLLKLDDSKSVTKNCHMGDA